MVGMIEPRRLIITTLSFARGARGDLDHSPAQRGRHSNGARTGQMVRRSGGAGTPTHQLGNGSRGIAWSQLLPLLREKRK